jgi:hypothetical protein
MARICRLRGKGRGGALTWAVLVSWLCLAGQIRIANAEEPAANVEAPRPSVFTVIVTRHGVRSPTKFLGGEYTWPRWDPVRDAFLTKHGYQLMTLMGAFYGEPVLGAPVDCGKVFVYADKDQRTYLTAQALLAGLCRPGTIGPIYHEPDVTAADPIFNGAKWVGKRINFSDSSNAIKAVAGDPPSKIVTSHAEDFAIFQRLLETRCLRGIVRRSSAATAQSSRQKRASPSLAGLSTRRRATRKTCSWNTRSAEQSLRSRRGTTKTRSRSI